MQTNKFVSVVVGIALIAAVLLAWSNRFEVVAANNNDVAVIFLVNQFSGSVSVCSTAACKSVERIDFDPSTARPVGEN